MSKWRKKPVVIDAFQWNGENDDSPSLPEWLAEAVATCKVHFSSTEVHVVTLEGVMKGKLRDFIVKGIQGEFYPVKQDIFLATYEEVQP